MGWYRLIGKYVDAQKYEIGFITIYSASVCVCACCMHKLCFYAKTQIQYIIQILLVTCFTYESTFIPFKPLVITRVSISLRFNLFVNIWFVEQADNLKTHRFLIKWTIKLGNNIITDDWTEENANQTIDTILFCTIWSIYEMKQSTQTLHMHSIFRAHNNIVELDSAINEGFFFNDDVQRFASVTIWRKVDSLSTTSHESIEMERKRLGCIYGLLE